MSKYRATVDASLVNTSHAQILQMVGSGRTVLDVGCASGYLAAALVKQGCTVRGIEYDPEAAERAAPHLAQLVVGDAGALDYERAFGADAFDVIIFGDVLEHIVDPETALRKALACLRPDGEVVISMPNVAHGSVRLALLAGSWQYTSTGLLDSTHVRFFTKSTLLEMIRSVGLQAVEIRGTTADPLGVEVDPHDDELPSTVVQWVRSRADAMIYQYVVKARRPDAETGMSADIPVVPAAELPPVHDHHSETVERERAELAELRHRLLTLRDHVIGLEATAAKAVADARRTQETVQQELAEIRASATWKAGRLAVGPVAWARRRLGGRP